MGTFLSQTVHCGRCCWCIAGFVQPTCGWVRPPPLREALHVQRLEVLQRIEAWEKWPFRRRHFSNVFCEMKIMIFWFKFHRNLLPKVHLIINTHWFWRWLGNEQATSHDLNKWCLLTHIFTSLHYCDVIMGVNASQITSLTIVYSTVYSDVDQRKHQSSASLAIVWGIHWGPVNSPHKWPVTRKMFPFDDVIMWLRPC